MPPLLTRIQTESLSALKKRETVRLQTLRLIVSQIQYRQIETQKDPTDEDVVTVIRKQIKEMTEANAQFAAASRQDLVGANLAQIAVLKEYLPTEISDDELKKLITEFIESNSVAYASNPRALTGQVVAALRSKAAPERISRVYTMISRK